MQHLEVSCAVRYIYIYICIYIHVIKWLKVNNTLYVISWQLCLINDRNIHD